MCFAGDLRARNDAPEIILLPRLTMAAIQASLERDILQLVKEMSVRATVPIDEDKAAISDDGKPRLESRGQPGSEGHDASLTLFRLETEVRLRTHFISRGE